MQRNHIRTLAVAALAVGGFAFVPTTRAADDAGTAAQNAANNTSNAAQNAADKTSDAAQNAADKTSNAAQNAADKTSNAAQNAGDKTSEAAQRTTNNATDNSTNRDQAKDAKDIRETLKDVTEAAVKKGTFDDLSERIAAPDRQRIGKFADQKFDDLDGRADEFLKDWKAKYNEDFDIDKANEIYNDQMVSISEMNPAEARTAGEKIKEGAKDAGEAIKDASKSAVGKESATDAEKKDLDRPTATATIAASHGLPEVKVNLVSEFPDQWKIDLPDTVDGQKLKDSVLKHLTMVDEDKANWPADKNDAYRLVSHHMLLAVAQPGEENATPAAGTLTPSTPSQTPAPAAPSNP
jgi:hypothetical protein